MKMQIIDAMKLDFKDVLLAPRPTKVSSRSDVRFNQTTHFKHAGSVLSFSGIGLIGANMDGVGTPSMIKAFAAYGKENDVFGLSVALTKHLDVEETLKLCQEYKSSVDTRTSGCVAWFSMGITKKDKERILYLRDNWSIDRVPVPYINLDVANGYTKEFVEALVWLRGEFNQSVIMAGSVCTPDMTEILLNSGADIVRVGIGAGSVCTTRYKTGVGYPQLSALIECGEVAKDLGGHICCDGGCASPGDICKAYAAGSSFVMVGGMFAGHSESEKPVKLIDGKQVVEFYGMSSQRAQEEHGGFKSYRASEGKVVQIPYRGFVKNTLDDMLGGLRSACAYSDALNLSELHEKATFVRSTIQTNNIFGNPQ
jgi:GMP reductase